MPSTAAKILLRLALCACAIWPLWRWLGPVALALGAPLFGVALAKPILDLAADAFRLVRVLVLRKLDGAHFAYRGVSIDVIDDESHFRWVRLVDLRKIVDGIPTDPVFQKTYPAGFRRAENPASGYLHDEALSHYLSKATTLENLRLRQWVERVIAFPARRVRQRYGIRSPASPSD